MLGEELNSHVIGEFFHFSRANRINQRRHPYSCLNSSSHRFFHAFAAFTMSLTI